MKHQCDEQCFTNFKQTIRSHVKRKVERYFSTDSRKKFDLCEPTMTTKEALIMLQRSRGKCAICDKTLILHNWDYNSRDQFSFDRLSDEDTHHIGNVQVTCLGCNIEKADNFYLPDHKWLHIYEATVTEFMTTNEYIQSDGIKNRAELIRYRDQLRSYLSHLHTLTYNNRKKNGWYRYNNAIISSHPEVVYPLIDGFD